MSFSHSSNWIDPFLKQNEGALFQFAGKHSATANRIALEAAKQFAREGREPEDIRNKTGWFLGEDDCWKFEISDHEASLDLHKFSIEEGVDVYKGPLGAILIHPKLYAAYPFLQNYDTHLTIRDNHEGYQEGARIEGSKLHGAKIFASANSLEKILDVLTHEIQHAIQEVEGFAYGSNANYLMTSYVASLVQRKKTLDDKHVSLLRMGATRGPQGRELDIIAAELTHIDYAMKEASQGNWNDAFYALYYNTAGEREARKTASDRRLNDEHRLKRSPIPSYIEGMKPTILFNGMPYQTVAGELNITPKANITLLPRETILKLSPAADRDTFNHECAHLFLRFEAATAQGRKPSDFQRTILEYLGVQSFSEINRTHEEKFANGFEAYMRLREFDNQEKNQSPIQKVFNSVAKWVARLVNSLDEQQELINEDTKKMFSTFIDAPEQSDYENEKMANNHERNIAMQLYQSGIYQRGEAYRSAQLLSSYALAKVQRDCDFPTVDRVFDQINLKIESVTKEDLVSDIVFDFDTFQVDEITKALSKQQETPTESLSQYALDIETSKHTHSSKVTQIR